MENHVSDILISAKVCSKFKQVWMALSLWQNAKKEGIL